MTNAFDSGAMVRTSKVKDVGTISNSPLTIKSSAPDSLDIPEALQKVEKETYDLSELVDEANAPEVGDTSSIKDLAAGLNSAPVEAKGNPYNSHTPQTDTGTGTPTLFGSDIGPSGLDASVSAPEVPSGNGEQTVGEFSTEAGKESTLTDPSLVPVVNADKVDLPEGFETISEYNEYVESKLKEVGLTDPDIQRIINGEITFQDLFVEIISDTDRSRYKRIMEARYLLGYFYDSETAHEQLDALNAQKQDLNDQLDEAVAKEDYDKMNQLGESLKQLDNQIIALTQLMGNYGDINFEFTSMDELDAAIRARQDRIDELLKQLDRLKTNASEYDAVQSLLNRLLNNGESTETILNGSFAFRYTDENGEEQICFNPEYASYYSINGPIEWVSFQDLYGDSPVIKYILEEIKDLNGWDLDEKVAELLGELADPENEHYEKDSQQKLEDCQKELEQLGKEVSLFSNIKKLIDSDINYYFENIDYYINQEDFDEKSVFTGNYDELYLNSFDDLYDKLCNAGFYDSSLTPEQIKENYEEYVGHIMAYIVNSSTNRDDPNYIIDDLAGMYAYPDIPLLGVTSSYKEDAMNMCEKWRKVMTDAEKDVFNYISQTEGFAAAYRYLQKIIPNLDERYVQEESQKDAEYAHDNRFLASLRSVFKKPLEGIGGMFYSLNCLLHDVKIRKSNTYSRADTWRGTVSNDISVLYGDTAAFFYNTGMSMTDTGLVIALTALSGGTGSFFFASTIMGSSVYLSTLNDALARGMEDGPAVALALVSACVESLMESYSVGHLMGLEKEFSEVLANNGIMSKIVEKLTKAGVDSALARNVLAIAYCTLDQAFIEGDEEFWTEVLDKFFDTIIAGDLSNRELAAKEYRETHPGCTEDEVSAYILSQVVGDLKDAWLGGVVSGLFFGLGKGSKTASHYNAMYRAYNEQIIRSFPPDRFGGFYGTQGTSGAGSTGGPTTGANTDAATANGPGFDDLAGYTDDAPRGAGAATGADTDTASATGYDDLAGYTDDAQRGAGTATGADTDTASGPEFDDLAGYTNDAPNGADTDIANGPEFDDLAGYTDDAQRGAGTATGADTDIANGPEFDDLAGYTNDAPNGADTNTAPATVTGDSNPVVAGFEDSSRYDNHPGENISADEFITAMREAMSKSDEEIAPIEKEIILRALKTLVNNSTEGKTPAQVQAELARFLYFELGRLLQYDEGYLYAKQCTPEELANLYEGVDGNPKTFQNLEDSNGVICIDWAHLYSQLLKDCGFEDSQIVTQRLVDSNGKPKTDSHMGMYLILGNGDIIIPDMTAQLASGPPDTYNVQMNNATTGFIIFKAEMIQQIIDSYYNGEAITLDGAFDEEKGQNNKKRKSAINKLRYSSLENINVPEGMSVEEYLIKVLRGLENEQGALPYQIESTGDNLTEEQKQFLDIIGKLLMAGNSGLRDGTVIEKKFFEAIRMLNKEELKELDEGLYAKYIKDISQFIEKAGIQEMQQPTYNDMMKDLLKDNPENLPGQFLGLDKLKTRSALSIRSYLMQMADRCEITYNASNPTGTTIKFEPLTYTPQGAIVSITVYQDSTPVATYTIKAVETTNSDGTTKETLTFVKNTEET